MNVIKQGFTLGALLGGLVFSAAAQAQTESVSDSYLYVSAGGVASRVEHKTNSSDGGGSEFHIGYAFNPSWSLELGYLDAISDKHTEPTFTSRFWYENGYQADGLVLSVLGKTKVTGGEFYYRAGLMQADVQAVTYYQPDDDNLSCKGGVLSAYQEVVDKVTYELAKCEIDDKKTVVLFGLGYKYDITDSFFVRTEVRRLFMRDGYALDHASLSLGYSF